MADTYLNDPLTSSSINIPPDGKKARYDDGGDYSGATELKATDTIAFTTPYTSVPSATPQPVLLFNPSGGTSPWQRIARRTRAQKMEFFYKVIQSPIGGVESGFTEYEPVLCRTILFYDRQPNGLRPAMTDILLEQNSIAITNSSIFSPPNLNNRDRFLFLYDDFCLASPYKNPLGPNVFNAQAPDWIVGPPPATAADGGNGVVPPWYFPQPYGQNVSQDRCKRVCIPLHGLETHFKGDSGALLSDIVTGAFWVMLMSDSILMDTPYNCTYNCRIYFTD